MKSLLSSILLLGFCIHFTGCASYMSYKSSEREIMGQRVVASGSDNAIRAFAMGDAVGIGVDILATEVVTKHPLRQIGAALLDALTAWGISEGIQLIDSGSNSRRSSGRATISGDNVNIIITSPNANITKDPPK